MNDVKEFNRAFGVDVPQNVQKDLFVQNPKLVKLKLDLILEEVDELKKAVAEHDMVETVDALADILYVVYGFGIALGIDLDEAFRRVHESNMSKLCKDEERARATIEWYKNKMNHVYDSPTYRKNETGQYVVINQSTGKILKSIDYHPVDLHDLCQ